jgi:aryl-alcohol dehydrogenase-like predicted oxidoreductase/spore coat polysaccharide biosynthesis protein SpsF (cytidylyltransferase family)
MKAAVLLQARTNSSRLPGKVLLPIAGIPMVVLAALRAGNTNHRVVVVTSSEPSDDLLCNELDRWEVSYFRGDLDNTLKRCVDALQDEPDEQVVVRLTGDNILPDGDFIDSIIEEFDAGNVAYLGCGGESSGLPYGVSAEVTRLGYLREANRKAESIFDCEHVTPWIIAKYGRNHFEKHRKLGMSQYRCTVDTLDDYLSVAGLFAGLKNPKDLPLMSLIELLAKASKGNVVASAPAKRLVLGTAQFGLCYGIANTAGRPEQALANRLLHTAIINGVQYIDTARAYGDSEQVLGRALAGGWSSRATVITKLSPLDDCPVDATQDIARAFAERSVYQSCHSLNVSKLDVLMLHRAAHLTGWNGEVWRSLGKLKHRGVIGELGVSVQSPEEALVALDFEDVAFIQLPFNILDYRWENVIKKVALVRQQRPVVIHARSALLQGLLTTDKEALWRRANCSNTAQVVNWLRARAKQYTNGDLVDLCLRFVLSQQWIDGVVIGVDTLKQLVDNLQKVAADYWPEDQLINMLANRPHISEETLNPATWNQADD